MEIEHHFDHAFCEISDIPVFDEENNRAHHFGDHRPQHIEIVGVFVHSSCLFLHRPPQSHAAMLCAVSQFAIDQRNDDIFPRQNRTPIDGRDVAHQIDSFVFVENVRKDQPFVRLDHLHRLFPIFRFRRLLCLQRLRNVAVHADRNGVRQTIA